MGAEKNRKVCRMPLFNLLLPVLMLFYVLGASADGNVTMESLTIYTTHEWFKLKPTVYFKCHEESKVYLPDVTHKNEEYVFMGQESWQPLTTLYGEKCKRCGLYEEDTVKKDDVFYEGELCPKDFTASPEGLLVLFKEKEFNSTLSCPKCGVISSTGSEEIVPNDSKEDDNDDKGAGLAFIIIVLVFVILFALGIVAYTKWRQRQRREQQARFVKMFEDDDDLDTEFGLKDDL